MVFSFIEEAFPPDKGLSKGNDKSLIDGKRHVYALTTLPAFIGLKYVRKREKRIYKEMLKKPTRHVWRESFLLKKLKQKPKRMV